jgi:hypothetical protein
MCVHRQPRVLPPKQTRATCAGTSPLLLVSKETWLKMVKVAREQLDEVRAPERRARRTSIEARCVREDHYALLLAARY